MKEFQIKKNHNNYYLQGLWQYPPKGFKFPCHIYQYVIDNFGNLNNNVPDSTIDSSFYQPAYPNFIYDSIYVGIEGSTYRSGYL